MTEGAVAAQKIIELAEAVGGSAGLLGLAVAHIQSQGELDLAQVLRLVEKAWNSSWDDCLAVALKDQGAKA